MAFSFLFFLISSFHSPKTDELLTIEHNEPYEGEITVVSDLQKTSYYNQYVFELNNNKRIQARFTQEFPLDYGAVCHFNGELTPPNGPSNPGQFDYPNFLEKQGMIALTNDPKISNCHSKSYLSYLYNLRTKLINYVEATYEEETVAWLKALLFGDRSELHDEVVEAFQFWNISHLLAISGLHVAFFIGFVYVVLHFIFRLPNEYIKWCLLVIIPIYIFVAGANPPVLRAGLMAVLILIFSMIQRRVDTTDVISVVLILILWFDPFLIYQLAFQFSFVVTLSLILSKHLLFQDHWILISLKVSIISQLAILPLQFDHFYFTNVLSFLANLIFVPYYTFFVIPVSLVLLIFIWFPPYFNQMVESAYLIVQEQVHSFVVKLDEPFIAAWVVGDVHLITVVAFYFLFILMMRTWDLGKLKVAAICGCLAISVFFVEQFAPYFDQTFKMTVLDVGQAESLVVELPKREAVFVIDVGEQLSYPFGEEDHRNYHNVIKPYLWSNGISQVDALFISHFDYDHVASAQLLVNDFRPSYIFSHPYIEDQTYLDESSMEKFIPLYEGVSFNLSGAQFYVLAPEGTEQESSNSENELSNVFILEVEGYQALFTGDMYESAEHKLIEKFDLSGVEFLKVAHHGSETSTHEQFLKAIDPNTAVISVGRNNRYNHPDSDVYERLISEGIEVFRTDENGAIIIKIRNGQSTISPFIP
ncbi:DNA internalization-related competence protein ComEC/Rec2 [Alkalibacillus silvisoli]|uniref:DNA internalization-related competence protein ComEC/Rec2 n=1 Tax=Alkalibacillus silvisoli TaxID=392823 RepID=A0ABP3JNU5_9BACI